ncbi:Notoamide biosynthesis cluster protein M' [Pseudocercospora fuligena]|uniref:Notoamide biosynthesis cluster protein M n=1 Tax=Pseudocercospora fuligena TaxID=685502 RepID=A0A8H6RU87_9PEZI|nr:Notoamide biosynthesis cluster protein M' [Pseudocercospora fuligena]
MSTAYEKVEVLEQGVGRSWRERYCELSQVLGSSTEPSTSSFVFINAGELKDDQDEEAKARHSRLRAGLNMPREFWTKMALDASGFFRATEHHNDEEELQVHESWLRLQAKQAHRDGPPDAEQLGEIKYHWDRLGFFIRWRPNRSFTAYCFDLPDELKRTLRTTLTTSNFTAQLPASIWSLILEHAMPLFDAQVWKCRHLIRWHEKHRPIAEDATAAKRPKPEYEDLHEIARHAIHSSEMLQTALHVLDAIEKEHSMFLGLVPQQGHHREITRSLSYHRTMLQGFEGRSRALETRLANEMQLTFHLNSQFDSLATGQIAQSSSEDSAAMRTISFLGLIFLPGTFISAIFSMSFFNFEPPNNATTQEWRMSSKFWIFWVFCVPITAATILLWTWWHNRTTQRLRNTSTFYIPEAKSDGKEQARLSLKLLTSRRALAQPKDVEKGMFDQAKRPEWTSYASSRSSQSPS